MLEFALALSLHLGMEGEYNSIHPYVKYTNELFIAGAYLNSESNISLFAGVEFDIIENLSLELGAVTGYSYADVAPFVRATYEINENYELFLAPAGEYNASGDLHFGAVIGLSYTF